MTIEQVRESGTRFAMNEITGQLVEFVGHANSNESLLWISGDGSPRALCLLLFDEQSVAENWSALSLKEARTRIDAYREATSLIGDLTCQRL